MPGLSGHDIVFAETSSSALRHESACRKIFLWIHANFDNIWLEISNWTRYFIFTITTFTQVEKFSTNIADCLCKIVSDNVLSMFSTRNLRQCWTISLTKRMCRRKARSFEMLDKPKNLEIGSGT